MKTLVIAEIFLPTIGGSVNWLINTYRRYPANEVVFVTPYEESSKTHDTNLPFPVLRLWKKFSSWDPTSPAILANYVSAILKIRKMCLNQEITQVHCAKVFPEGILAMGIKWAMGIPYIIYAHGEEITVGRSSRKLAWFMPKVYNGADLVIANSNNTKMLLEDIHVRSDGIHVIHPGVDYGELQKSKSAAGDIRMRLGLGNDPVILILGRLQRRKGQDMLIRALPQILEKFPNTHCLVVGTGEEEGYLKDLTQKLGVQESVKFTGKVDDGELGGMYSLCDVFVMPNRQIDEDIEGFGMVYLEAAALGKPAIGGKSGGTNDAIVDGVTGMLVDGTKVEEIARAVISLLSRPEWGQQMGENGRKRVEKEFSWERVYNETRQLVMNL